MLKEQHLKDLEQQAESGFGSFLSVKQFARQYGGKPAVVNAVTSYLQSYGISTDVYADNVDIVATGTAGQFDQALQVSQSQYTAPAQPSRNGLRGRPAQSFHGSNDKPSMPSNLASQIVAILGLTNYAEFDSQVARTDSQVVKPDKGSSNSCVALTGLASDCNLPSDFARRYDLNPLYSQGAEGKGQTVGIVMFAALDQGAPQYFWQHIAHTPQTNRTVSTVNIDGGPGAPSIASGSDETDVDVEESGGVAPAANVVVYQAPNSDYGLNDAVFDVASQNVASSVSLSFASSEDSFLSALAQGEESAGEQEAFDEAFLEFAAQGQSGFVASGDSGAYSASRDLGTTELSANTPADSPYVTAAGGTTLPWSATLPSPSGTGPTATVNVPRERIWGSDYVWPALATITGESLSTAAESYIAGGGGGFSELEPQPTYQQGVSGTSRFSAVPYLTPTDYQTVDGLYLPTEWSFNPSPNITLGSGSGRAIPDLATDADPYTGYLAYIPSEAAVGASPLQSAGGTSFVAPQLNGSAAVIDSYLGHRVGLWNPAMYRAAQRGNSPFTPLDAQGTSNDNLYYTGTPGTLFNEGAGLGIPNLTKLAGDL